MLLGNSSIKKPRKKVAALLSNNFGGNSAQSLLSSSPFYAQLTKSLVLNRGTGTPTYTGASTKTVRDHEGVLRTTISGEARFEGARRVRNLIPTTSEDFSNAAWTLINGGTGTAPTKTPNYAEAPDGTTTACRVVANRGAGNTASDYSGMRIALAYSGTQYTMLRGTYVKSNTGSSQTFVVSLNSAATPVTTTTEWTRVSDPEVSSNGNFDIGTYGGTGSQQAIDILIWHPQAEDITGRTDQTTPSEYVSVGVLSAPYHGAGVDGVKYFDTDLSGNPIAASINTGYVAEGARTNLCLQSNAFTTTWIATGTPSATKNVTGPDGVANSAWTLTDNDAGVTEDVHQNINLTAATYTDSIFVKKTTGAQASYPTPFFLAGTTIAICTIDTSNGVATAWTAYTGLTIATGLTARCTSFNDSFWRVEISFTGTAATWTKYLVPAGTTNATQSTGVIDVAAQGSAVFYGAQVELGSFASSYIPTTTIAVARNADVLTYPSAGNFSDTAGWVYAEHSEYANAASNSRIVGDGNTTGAGTPLYGSSASTSATYDGTSVIGQGLPSTSDVTTVVKSASSWGGSTRTVLRNASALGSGAYDGSFGLSSIGVGVGGSSPWFGTIRNVRIGQRALSSSELTSITR